MLAILARYGWAPSTICSISKIKSLQRRAKKFILNTHWQRHISYHERLSRLNLLSLTNWNEVKELIFLFQVLRWPLHVTHRWLRQEPKGTRLTRQSSGQDVLIPKCRAKLFQFSYFNRTAKLWNTLPESTRTLTSLNRFKSHALQRNLLKLVEVT